MGKKIQPGDKIRVKNANGDGHGTFIGIDDRSGMPIVAMEKIVVDDGVKKVPLENVQAYVTPGSMRRE